MAHTGVADRRKNGHQCGIKYYYNFKKVCFSRKNQRANASFLHSFFHSFFWIPNFITEKRMVFYCHCLQFLSSLEKISFNFFPRVLFFVVVFLVYRTIADRCTSRLCRYHQGHEGRKKKEIGGERGEQLQKIYEHLQK